MFKSVSFTKLFVGFYVAIIISLILDTYVVNAATLPVIAPVVSLTMARGDSPSIATVLTSDGELYTVENPWEDTFPGDLWLMSRDDRGTKTPTDDRLEVVDSIGYEISVDGIPGVYEWHIWDRGIGDYRITYSNY